MKDVKEKILNETEYLRAILNSTKQKLIEAENAGDVGLITVYSKVVQDLEPSVSQLDTIAAALPAVAAKKI